MVPSGYSVIKFSSTAFARYGVYHASKSTSKKEAELGIWTAEPVEDDTLKIMDAISKMKDL